MGAPEGDGSGHGDSRRGTGGQAPGGAAERVPARGDGISSSDAAAKAAASAVSGEGAAPEGAGPDDAARRGGGDDGAQPSGTGRGGMPRWLPRALVLALALLAAFRILTWAFHQTLGLLLNVLIAFFLALAMEPPVDRLARLGMRRGPATALVGLALLIAGAGFFAALGSVVADQVTRIVQNLPAYIGDVVGWVNATFHTDVDVGRLSTDLLRSDWVRGHLSTGAQSVWGISATVFGGLFQLLTIALFTFYFAADGPRLRAALCSVLPPARQVEVLRAWEIAVTKTGGYIYSRALMALVSAVAHYVFFQVLDVPYAPALGIWVGAVSQFVPTVGTYLAGALPMLIAFTANPWSALWVLGFVVLYQQFENYLLQPRITARTVDIHPAVAFGSVIAGTALMGVIGALVAVPATATLQGFLGAYVKHYELAETTGATGTAGGGSGAGRAAGSGGRRRFRGRRGGSGTSRNG